MDAQQKELVPNDLVDIDQAVAITGYARKTIYGFTHNKQIPFFKKRRRLYFSEAKLKQWVIDNTTTFEPA